MNAIVQREIRALRHLGFNSFFYSFAGGGNLSAPYIDCCLTGHLVVNVCQWRIEVDGIYPCDCDQSQQENNNIVMAFAPTREGFRRAYRAARLCVRVPTLRHNQRRKIA